MVAKTYRTPNARYVMKASVWLYSGMAGWHFITLPKKESEKIKSMYKMLARGWGSLPVLASIGATSWKTSIFPDKKAGAYLLPLKADVRKKEKLSAGDKVTFSVEILA